MIRFPFSIALEPGTAGAAAVLVAAIAAAVLWFRALRPGPAAALRAAALGVLALCALQASVQRLKQRLLLPRLAILIDTSSSMAARDGERQTRLERATAWLKDNRAQIEKRAEPVLFSVADRSEIISWEGLDKLKPMPVSFDPAALDDAARGAGPARQWLLSDGAQDDREPAAPAVATDAVGVGPKKPVRAVAIGSLQSPDFVFLHSRFNVTVAGEAAELAGQKLLLKVRRGDENALAETIQVHGDFDVFKTTLALIAGSLGQESYRIDVSAGDKVLASRAFRVEVIRQKHRIMYLAGRPSPEYSHLREHLKSDPNHELVSFVILRNPDNINLFPDNELSLIPFPAQEIFVQNLFQFDLFILENFGYWRFNLPVAYLEGLKRFVRQGGALLVLGGSNAYAQGGYRATPLEEALPVDLWATGDDYSEGLFKPKLTLPDHPLLKQADTIEASEALWDNLAPLDGFNRFNAVKPGATVLLTHPTEKLPNGSPMPLVAIREFGKGKVMVLGTDSTWRWKLGSGGSWKTASFYGRFWSKAVQYLSGTLDLKKVKFSPLPDRMPPQEPALLTLHLFDDSFRPLASANTELKVLWTAPKQEPKAVSAREREPGVYEIALTGLAPGPHSVRAVARYRGQPWGEDMAKFVWEPQGPESPLRRRWLKALAQGSKGEYVDLQRARSEELLERLPPARQESEVLARWHVWAWPGWFPAAGLLLLLEWILRRRAGQL